MMRNNYTQEEIQNVKSRFNGVHMIEQDENDQNSENKESASWGEVLCSKK